LFVWVDAEREQRRKKAGNHLCMQD